MLISAVLWPMQQNFGHFVGGLHNSSLTEYDMKK